MDKLTKAMLFRRVGTFAVAPFLLCLAASPGAQLQKVRSLPHQNVPIESRLQPDDQVVEMDYWADVMYVSHDNETREQQVERMAGEASSVSVVRVTQVEPFLAENGSWIRTRVAGVIDEVLKGSNDKKFEAQLDGGEMLIRGVRIKAGSYPVARPGTRYLVFAQSIEGTSWIVDMFTMDNGKGVSRPEWARAKGLPPNPFDRRSSQQTIAEVRKALGRR